MEKFKSFLTALLFTALLVVFVHFNPPLASNNSVTPFNANQNSNNNFIISLKNANLKVEKAKLNSPRYQSMYNEILTLMQNTDYSISDLAKINQLIEQYPEEFELLKNS